MEWMDEVKLSPTTSLKLDSDYQTRREDEEAERNTCRRHMREDLIWRAHLKMEEYNHVINYKNNTKDTTFFWAWWWPCLGGGRSHMFRLLSYPLILFSFGNMPLPTFRIFTPPFQFGLPS
jgi:hypothetical protein